MSSSTPKKRTPPKLNSSICTNYVPSCTYDLLYGCPAFELRLLRSAVLTLFPCHHVLFLSVFNCSKLVVLPEEGHVCMCLLCPCGAFIVQQFSNVVCMLLTRATIGKKHAYPWHGTPRRGTKTVQFFLAEYKSEWRGGSLTKKLRGGNAIDFFAILCFCVYLLLLHIGHGISRPVCPFEFS